MFLYTVIEAIIAVIAGILIAICTKKTEGVTYNKLDKIGQVTNILLCLFYIGFSFSYLFLGIIANPRYNGFLRWIVSIIMASAALFCGIGLGLSVAFRKRGKANRALPYSLQVLRALVLQLLYFSFFMEIFCVLSINKG